MIKKKLLTILFFVGLIYVLALTASAVQAPEVLLAEQSGSNAASLSWSEVPQADGYVLYRQDDDGSRRLVKTVLNTSCMTYSLENGRTYTFFVRAFENHNGARVYGPDSKGAQLHIGIAAPEITSVSLQSSTSVRIQWKADPEANSHMLYRSADGEHWTLVKSVTSTETVTYGLESGKTYSFRLRSLRSVNGTLRSSEFSQAESIFMGLSAPESFTAEMASSTYARLRWSAVPGAESYRLYRSVDGGAFSLVKTVAETETFNYSLSPDHRYVYRVAAIAAGGAVRGDEAEIELVNVLAGTSQLSAEYAGDNSVKISWEPVAGATAYRLYRGISDGAQSLVKTVTGTETVTYQLEAGQTYTFSVRPIRQADSYTISGPISVPVQYLHCEPVTVYRAVLIGEEGYTETLHGPANDIVRMETLLRGAPAMDWQIFSKQDATKNEIVSMVELAFADADADDVSLFYYSGHGVTDSGEYYSGALMPVDYSPIPTLELAALLSGVSGRVIVILDSCGSGAAIYEQGENGTAQRKAQALSVAEVFDPVQFNDAVISAFSGQQIQSKSGELRTDKFHVLTSSGYEQNSISVNTGNIWGGALTRGITAGAGMDFNSQTWQTAMPGDKNQDRVLSFGECCAFAVKSALDYQNVQCFPQSSTLAFLIRS